MALFQSASSHLQAVFKNILYFVCTTDWSILQISNTVGGFLFFVVVGHHTVWRDDSEAEKADCASSTLFYASLFDIHLKTLVMINSLDWVVIRVTLWDSTLTCEIEIALHKPTGWKSRVEIHCNGKIAQWTPIDSPREEINNRTSCSSCRGVQNAALSSDSR